MTSFSFEDVIAIEGDDDTTELQHYVALQRAINGGHWSFQGSYGRAMMGAIEAGKCMLGENSARDYWGNFIPSRTQVQDGTKGSASFVEENSGAEWRAAMEAA
jgi:hypothetical protein